MQARLLTMLAWLGMAATARAADAFVFESIHDVADMRAFTESRLAGSPSRADVRNIFVMEGKATQIVHPRRKDVEKYLYDINLCGYYVWRWNISADYDARDRLRQIYVNGEPVLNGAEPEAPPTSGPFYRLARPRPEAGKGEWSLAAIITDRDGDLQTSHDQHLLTGLGPTRVDPLNMGKAHPYRGEVWRSIFDSDNARFIAPYVGDCAAVDATLQPMIAKALPPPDAMTEAAISSWVASRIKADGWTLIATATGEAVIFGGPDGVSRLNDGTMEALIRKEYFRSASIGGVDVRSTSQRWNIDCAGRRMRVLDMSIHGQNNLSGPSMSRAFQAPAWVPVAADERVNDVVLTRVCEAPTTGRRLK